jgi:hypothetical protein
MASPALETGSSLTAVVIGAVPLTAAAAPRNLRRSTLLNDAMPEGRALLLGTELFNLDNEGYFNAFVSKIRRMMDIVAPLATIFFFAHTPFQST